MALTAGYGGSPVVHGVSISVAPGEVVSIVGPNGSGKSTLLKSIVGVVEVLSGRVLVGDRDVTGWAAENVARIGVGYVPQIDDVFAPLTVRENLEMGGYLLKPREVPARVEHVMGVFPQLARMAGRRAGKLSGGERKMLAMGRALMLQPAAGRARRADRQPGADHRQHRAPASTYASSPATGASVLVVEQRARAVLEISDRTYVLGGGRCGWRARPARARRERPEFIDSFLGGGAWPRRARPRAPAARQKPDEALEPPARPGRPSSTGARDRMYPSCPIPTGPAARTRSFALGVLDRARQTPA